MENQVKALKDALEDKKDDLSDKADTLDALTADINDINNAIKSIAPQKYACPIVDDKSIEENRRYEEDLVPRISSLEDKLERLEAVQQRISSDCNPSDAKKLENRIAELKDKCKDKQKKKDDRIKELEEVKDTLKDFDDVDTLKDFDEVGDKLRTWLENQMNDLKNQDPPAASIDELKEQLHQKPS